MLQVSRKGAKYRRGRKEAIKTKKIATEAQKHGVAFSEFLCLSGKNNFAPVDKVLPDL